MKCGVFRWWVSVVRQCSRLAFAQLSACAQCLFHGSSVDSHVAFSGVVGEFLPKLGVDDFSVLSSFVFLEVEWAYHAVGSDVDGVGVQCVPCWMFLDATPGLAGLHHDDWSKVVFRAQFVKF